MLPIMPRARLLPLAGFLAMLGGALWLPGTVPFAGAEAGPLIEQYDLDNGLTVVLAPNRNSETVSTVVLYEAGSADEPPGRSGFAHLFEHLMFEGTHDVPDFDAAVSAVGGDNNAFTQWDSTTYHNTGPKEALPEFLRLEADRMANVANAVTQEDLDNQRAVVLNEMRQNTLDTPGGAAVQQAAVAMAPEAHPYAHAVIGSIKDLEQAKLEDVVAFHRLHYVPDRATLSISGNFDIAKTKADIEKTFGIIPAADRGSAIGRWFAGLGKLLGLGSGPDFVTAIKEPKTLVFKDAVTEPVVSIGWAGPEGLSKEGVERLLLGAVLSTGKSSLQQQLVIDDRIANSAGAGWDYRNLGGQFSVTASAAKGVDADKLEKALRDTLAAFARDGISEDALNAARSQLRESLDQLPNSPLAFAVTLANTAAWDGKATDWREEERLAAEITPEDLTETLQTLLDAPAVTLRVLPGPRNDAYPPVLANSTGTPQPVEAPARADIRIPKLELAASAGVKLPEGEERTLASGAKLRVYPTSDTQRSNIVMIVPGGSTATPPALADLALNIGSRGIGETTLVQLDQKLKQEGIGLSGNAHSYTSILGASAPLKKFDMAADYLADSLARPRFDAREWQAMIESASSGIEQRKLNPGYQALRGLIEQVYPPDAPEARESTEEGLKALTMEQARQIFDGLVQPERATFHVVSNLGADEIKARLDKAFAEWKGGRPVPVAPPPTRPVVKEGSRTRAVAGATQSMILMAMPAPEPGTPQATAFDMAVRILGGTFKSRLNLELREKKGWSYGISAETNGDKGIGNTLLYVQASVEAAHTQESIAEIRRIVKALATQPITAEEFETARKTLKADFLGVVSNADSLTSMVAGLESTGFTLGDAQVYLKQVDDLTLEDVQAQANEIAKLPIALSVAGDAAKMK